MLCGEAGDAPMRNSCKTFAGKLFHKRLHESTSVSKETLLGFCLRTGIESDVCAFDGAHIVCDLEEPSGGMIGITIVGDIAGEDIFERIVQGDA